MLNRDQRRSLRNLPEDQAKKLKADLSTINERMRKPILPRALEEMARAMNERNQHDRT